MQSGVNVSMCELFSNKMYNLHNKTYNFLIQSKNKLVFYLLGKYVLLLFKIQKQFKYYNTY